MSRPSAANAEPAFATANKLSRTSAPIALQDLPNLGLRPERAEDAGAGADDGDRLAAEALSGQGREAQSSAFLSAPGIEWLYSGVAISDCVGLGEGPPQRFDGRCGELALGLVVLAVRGQGLEPSPFEELDGRRQLGRGGVSSARL